MAQTKKHVFIYIEKDQTASLPEVARRYQINGVTYTVKVGERVEVPLVLAEEIKRIGDIENYTE